MCPLRLILIFLSASLAGFFVIKNLKSQPQSDDDDADDSVNPLQPDSSKLPTDQSSKVWCAIRLGFWTFVDMASGMYLWRNLLSSKRSI